jgi:hypothetical protein
MATDSKNLNFYVRAFFEIEKLDLLSEKAEGRGDIDDSM